MWHLECVTCISPAVSLGTDVPVNGYYCRLTFKADVSRCRSHVSKPYGCAVSGESCMITHVIIAYVKGEKRKYDKNAETY